MLTKNQKHFIQNLQQKKYRQEVNMFVVEGLKSISEFLKEGFSPHILLAHENIPLNVNIQKVTQVSLQELKSVSSLKNPQDGLAVFNIPTTKLLKTNDLTLALDNIQDPGNLGTIIRLADWFNIKNIICSQNTVDCYNPKVVQATMGSLSRVNILYTNLLEYLKNTPQNTYACVLNGNNLYKTTPSENSCIVLGNEANGISPEIIQICKQKITIPQFGENSAESLNVAIAASIIVSHFKSNI